DPEVPMTEASKSCPQMTVIAPRKSVFIIYWEWPFVTLAPAERRNTDDKHNQTHPKSAVYKCSRQADQEKKNHRPVGFLLLIFVHCSPPHEVENSDLF
ncbi:MAG: hypothetical protein KJ649_08930, partial [Proteobacteria bacterium]|nr:hypothetical protein [Pseudomonadota bacterium]